MSLEKSVLDLAKMREILSSEYGLQLIDYSDLSLGSANCYRVHCKEGDFFLKEYQSDFTKNMVNTEADIVSCLISRDFPVAGFVKTKSGDSSITYENHVISLQDFALYVKEYMKYAPLTKRDLEAMPFIYLFQLTQSSYGYKEYLVTKTENKEALLEFAFWRTNICRELYQRALEISAALIEDLC